MASTSKESEQTPVNREKKPEVQERTYNTKVIQFFGRNAAIVLQNDNGACALIAICNVLVLRNYMDLITEGNQVSERRLIKLVNDHLLAACMNNKDVKMVDNQLKNILNARNLLPSFASGINVDIKFNRINDFEVTKERAIFDFLQIPLYHGWIIDPMDIETVFAIGTKSHDKLVKEFVVPHMDALKLTESVDGKLKDVVSSSHVVDEGELVRNFLENNATQLTPYGLSRLKSDIKEGEISVLFRNNHFNTMFRFEGELFILVTDEGYKSTPGVVWEKLDEVKHTLLANSEFKILNPSTSEKNSSSKPKPQSGSSKKDSKSKLKRFTKKCIVM